jgi:hypothetical protein
MSYSEPDKYTVIRSEQTDEQYISRLNTDISQLLAALTNNDISRRFSTLVSSVCYYAATILCRRQTIGQEVFNLVLYGHDIKNVPTTFSIFRYVCLRTLTGLFVRLKPSQVTFKMLQWSLVLASKLVIIAYMINLTSYSSLEHLISRISYHQLYKEYFTNLGANAKLLGYLRIVELVLFFVYVGKTIRQKLKQVKSKEKAAAKASQTVEITTRKTNLKCFICIEGVNVPTAATCGHIYCWKCINSLINSNQDTGHAKCPICRSEIRENDIVWLNY